ncbi:HAD family hydrolase [Thermus scotoductus]|uniref:Hydrolase n=1 Tax=Thermus scotoductus TaxID=37636 RepID=A0A430RDS7_THESC|nr:HAD family phosphatase [Thermus scotoductus]RTH05489.1 hydrolase [Thermus scotoductus]RTI02955.1 hydrolase [Thermus scotoductus]RTI09712.1 hydrolase [Thermus scotoductus]RTI41460.1 hydrolase [Thermus scotoductus]
MLKALLFDLDGTLADTDPLHLLAWREVLAPYGLEVNEDFYRKRISGRLNPEIVKDLLGLEGEEARRLIEAKEARFRELALNLKPIPGLEELLEKARARGLTWGVVTNAPRENARHVLKALGLNPPLLVLAEEVGRGKPDPLPYRVALRHLGLTPREALAFEDSPSGVRSAVGAGIPTYALLTGHKEEALLEAGAWGVLQDFRKAMELL